jgi:branched-chain amino acid aminotransferase
MSGVYYSEGEWFDEDPKILRMEDHAFWLASVVFDGARAFNGCVPDLDMHCKRVINSANVMGLKPTLTAEEIEALCIEGVRKLPQDSELYIRPMFYGTTGFLVPDPDGTKFALAVYHNPLPGFGGFSACLSTRRRPAKDMAPTDAKAACLYPNTQRALREANKKGFDNAILLDANGNVAEFATANIWIVKDGKAYTPAVNGTFLAGVTRSRVAQLLSDDGIEVIETQFDMKDVMDADEVFNSGNYGKVMPATRIEDRALQPGPVANRARDLYFEYAETCNVF